MKKRNYRWYVATYRLNEKLDRKLTITGKAVFICAFALIFFGLNTRSSMLFVIFAAAIALLITDALSLVFKNFNFEFERFLPDCVSKGSELKYSVLLRSRNGKNGFDSLFYSEVPANPLPSFEVFDATKEPGEEKRNAFDRKMGYYRWKWIVSKNCGGNFGEFPVSGREADGGIIFNARFLPERRGKIGFGGAYIFYKGIFGLIKRGKVIENPGSFLVLPEIRESFDIPDTEGGNVNENNEKTRETNETGSGFELKSVRDFVPGDSLRNIHWKSSAKSGQLRTKEFYKEVDSGSVMFVDNFFEEHYSEDFEKILSAAATLLNKLQKEGNLPQILFVGRNFAEIPDSSGKSFGRALSMLALAENDSVNKFEGSSALLLENIQSVSSVLFFTSKYDRSRMDALKYLAGAGVQVFVFYAGNAESGRALQVYEKKIDF
ncbi:DUF58 domain-containing protein [bacterium]|nr:DUF58 domain-containing protein [bacterium]